MEDISKNIAVMNVNDGETIVGAWVTLSIPTVGLFKLLAKKRTDGKCEWVHFIQRTNGEKTNFYRGETNNEDEISIVVNTLNAALAKTFSSAIQLQIADTDIYSADGKPLGNATVN